MNYILNSLIISILFICTHVYAANEITSVNISYNPRGFIISKDGSRAFVATGTCDVRKNLQQSEIDVVNLDSITLISRINIPMEAYGCLSGQLFLTADEKKLYVDYGKVITVVDTSTFTILKNIKLSENEYLKHAVSSTDKTKLYYSVETHSPNDNVFMVLDTKTDKFIDKFPNIKGAFSYGVYGMAMSYDGKTIYEIPGVHYRELEPLMALDINSKKSLMLGTLPPDTRILSNGLIVSKEDKTFYLSTSYNLYTDPISDWYIYAIDKATMISKLIYQAEHSVRAIGLSNDERELYILDLRYGREKITIINADTGSVIKNVPGLYGITEAKVFDKSGVAKIYYTTEPGNGHGSLFNVISR